MRKCTPTERKEYAGGQLHPRLAGMQAVRMAWKGLIDKKKGLWSEDVNGALAETSSALPETKCRAVATENLRRPRLRSLKR